MKNLIYAALLVVGSLANAETYCSISGQNPSDKSTFDQTILAPEKVEKEKSYVLKNGKVLNVDTSKFSTIQQWQSLHGAYIVSVNQGEETDSLAAVVARIDTRNLQNMTRLQSAAFGKKMVSLMDYRGGFAVSCFQP